MEKLKSKERDSLLKKAMNEVFKVKGLKPDSLIDNIREVITDYTPNLETLCLLYPDSYIKMFGIYPVLHLVVED